MEKQEEELDQESPVDPEEASQEGLDSKGDSLETLGKELDQTKDLLLRKQAEFENYRKRIRKERGEQRLAAQAEVFEKLLPTLDALEKGLESLREAPENSELETYRQGYEFMLQEIRSVLEKFGVTEIPGLGNPFDPNIHEAVLREVTSEHEDGKILEEFRKGYQIQHRLLRPAQVRVTVQPDHETVSEGKGEK